MFIQIIQYFPLASDYSGGCLPLFEWVQSVAKVKSLQVISRLLGNNTGLFECYSHQPTTPINLLVMVVHCTGGYIISSRVSAATHWRGIRYGSLRGTSMQQAEKKKKNIWVYTISNVFLQDVRPQGHCK